MKKQNRKRKKKRKRKKEHEADFQITVHLNKSETWIIAVAVVPNVLEKSVINLKFIFPFVFVPFYTLIHNIKRQWKALITSWFKYGTCITRNGNGPCKLLQQHQPNPNLNILQLYVKWKKKKNKESGNLWERNMPSINLWHSLQVNEHISTETSLEFYLLRVVDRFLYSPEKTSETILFHVQTNNNGNVNNTTNFH